MANNYISPETIRGHIDTFILLSLKNEDKDSNDIRLDIEAKSDNKYSVKQGTFYSAMQRLVKQNYVSEYRTSAVDGIRRKYFSLTEKGRIFLEKSITDWSESKGFIDEMIDAPVEEKAETQEIKEEKPTDEFESLKNIALNSDEVNIDVSSYLDDTAYFDSISKEVLDNLADELKYGNSSPDTEIVKDNKIDDIIEENEENYENDINEISVEKEKKQEDLKADNKAVSSETTKDDDESESVEVKVNYKEVLNKLFPKTVKKEPERAVKDYSKALIDEDQNIDSVQEDVIEAEVETNVNSQGEIDFSDLYEMSRREGFKLRTSHSTNKRSESNIFINKLRCHSSIIAYAILFLEMVIMKIAFNSSLNWPIAAQIILPIAFFAYPLAMLIARFVDPGAVVDEVKSFKDAMEIALLIAFQLLILIFGVALFVAVDFNNPEQVLNFIIIPFVIDLNIPIYVIIKYTLLSGGKYFKK